MSIESYDDKKNLPKGIVMEVSDSSYWNGQRWIKTGDSTWARLGRAGTESVLLSDEELEQMVAEGRNNVSPCPSELLIFPEAYAEWNLQVLAKAALMLSRDLRISTDRQRVLEQRNEKARLALAGIVEEA